MPDWAWSILSAAAIAGRVEFAKVIADELSKRGRKKRSDYRLWPGAIMRPAHAVFFCYRPRREG